ncbi:MAG: divergent PAP2 family protein [Candidatus Kerfeldbacteria bacterium]|nr:divergent PAP2 family protein [Candidatus Kerfeldbacteria bacterium]
MGLDLKLILIPVMVALITQLIKFLTSSTQRRTLDWGTLIQYGGMPSGHTAFVIALMTVVGYAAGIASAAFAVATALAIVVIRDAVSFRQYLSRYGHALNLLLKEHPERAEASIPKGLEERLGHTPAQALVGAVIGFVLSTLFYIIIP